MTISETIVEAGGISGASFLRRRVEKQLHLKHMIQVEKADQTIPRSSCVACTPLADGGLCCMSHALVQLGSYFLLQILVLYCAGGSSFGKGLPVDFLAAELRFLLPALLVASFFLCSVCD